MISQEFAMCTITLELSDELVTQAWRYRLSFLIYPDFRGIVKLWKK
jgi:hypothetical protein